MLNKSQPAIWFGAVLFCAVIFIAGYLTPSYSHLHQAISELGAPNARYAWLTRWFGFIPLGLSFLLFAYQSRNAFTNAIPFYLFLFTGIAIVIAGIFPTDTHGRRDTLSGMVHAIAGIALLCLLSMTPLLLTLSSLYRTPPPKWILIFCFGMGILVAIFFVMLPNGMVPQLIAFHQRILGDYFKVWYPLHGLHQRLLLLLYFIWLFVFSRFIYQSPAY